jgi:hypothetical protein
MLIALPRKKILFEKTTGNCQCRIVGLVLGRGKVYRKYKLCSLFVMDNKLHKCS